MAVANRIPVGELKVANTSNVKEMKNGRPMNVKLEGADLENCVIVTLGAAGTGENDHVFSVAKVLTPAEVDAAVKAGTAYLVVAPEIMVEEARMTDGHIGKFRFKQGAVHTAYKLSKHDRLEVSANHPAVKLAQVEVSERKMAEAMYLLEEPAAAIVMKKIEF